MAFELQAPKRAGATSSTSIRMARNATGAVRVAFPKSSGIEPGSRVSLGIGRDEDRGWILVQPVEVGGYKVSRSGGVSSITFTPDIRLKAAIPSSSCECRATKMGGFAIKVPADLVSTIWPDPALVAA